MNTRNLLISVSMLLCILLSACVPAATPPTAMPAISTEIARDPNALTKIAGTYKYTVVGFDFHILLRPDGTYAMLNGSGNYTVTPDQITFVDTLPASGSPCSSEAGVYKWTLDGPTLSLVSITDHCDQRSTLLESNSFEKGQEDPNTPVDFVWRITGAPHPFVRPTNMALDEQSNIFVVDGGNHRIQKFDTNGMFLRMWGEYGDGDGQFIFRVELDHFGAIAVDASGNVYVTDYNSRVQKFDANGKFLMKWGDPGSGDGQFAAHSHASIAVDVSGNVYVSDANNYRIQKFDSNGKFLLKWGSKGSDEGKFGESMNWSGPEGIAVDGQGNVYVVDPANYRIEKFDANGNFIIQWGSQGTEDGQFLDAGGIAIDQQGNVYVTDNQQNVGGPTSQVSKFDSNGKFLLKWGSTGTDLGLFNYPSGIAVDQQGNIYVISVIENVQKFKPK